jgi:hypothetical protein
MNRRFALTAVACLFSALTPSFAVSQAKPAATSAPPAAPAKWVPPVKGTAYLEFIEGKSQRAKGPNGPEIQTKFKVKNTSKGAIGLLSVEQIWYNTKREIATNGVYRHRALLNPGEIIEFTITTPDKPDLYTNMLMFKHANGTVEPKRVKEFTAK